MKSLILALAASAALVGGAYAQQGTATAPDTQTEATTVPADQAGAVTSTDAAPAGEEPTATEAEEDATTADPANPRRLPATGAAPSTEGQNPTVETPTQTDTESDATTAQ